jgi:cell wall-associated NlpC family hydrolase
MLGAMSGSTVIGNSHQFVQLLVQLSGILQVLTSNPYFSLFLVYFLTLRSYLSRLSPLLGGTVKGIQGFVKVSQGMGGDFGPAGKVGAGLRNFVTGMKDSEAAASSATGFMGTLGGGITKVVKSVGSGIVSFGKWVAGLKIANLWQKIVTGAQAAFNLVMDANPIMLVVLAIVALVAIFVVLWTHSAAFRKFWIAVWHDILSIVQVVWNWVKRNWPLLLAILTGPIGLAVLFFVKNFGRIRQMWSDLVNVMRNVWRAFTGWLTSVFTPVVNVWHSVWGGVSRFFSNWMSNLKSDFSTLWRWVRDLWDGLGRAWNAVWSGVKNIIKTPLKWVVQHVWNPFANLVDRFTSFLHLGRPVPTIDASGWQTGGRIPGYGGGDTVPAYLERGEAIVPKQHVNDPFFAAWAAGKRIPGFQLGGLVGDIWHSVSGLGSHVLHGLEHLALGFLKDTAAPVAHALLGLLSHIPDSGSGLTQAFAKLPRTVVDAFLAWLDKKDAAGGGQAIVEFAKQFIHKVPYVWGGTTTSGWDCSGMAGYVYHHFGYTPPRTAGEQQVWAKSSGDIPGALVFFYGRNGGAEHVGITMGNGSYVGADSPALGTTIQPTAGNTGFGIPPGGFHNRGAPGGMPMSANSAVELGRSMAADYGWTGIQFTDLNMLWTKESGWNANARNPSSGAAGIPQDITGNFHGGARGQIAWGLQYIRGRYGNPANAWAHEMAFNWYDGGGIWPSGSFGANMSGSPEVVLKAGQWDAMYAIGRAAQASIARGGDGASAVEYHAHFDGLTGAAIQGHVRTAFHQMQIAAGAKQRVGRRH